jgi:hypothetical protein
MMERVGLNLYFQNEPKTILEKLKNGIYMDYFVAYVPRLGWNTCAFVAATYHFICVSASLHCPRVVSARSLPK